VLNDPLDWVDPLGLDAFKGDDCPWEASCEPGSGGIGIGIGIWIGGGHGGGGVIKNGGTNPPIPPPNNPGTTFPGNPSGQTICVNFPNGSQVCASRPYPSWFAILLKNLGGAALVSEVFVQAIGNNVVDEFKSGGCVNTFFRASADALNPLTPSASTLADPTATFYSYARFNAVLRYAASRPNYLGGQGLIYPLKSAVFRSMLSDAVTSSGAGFGVSVDLSLLQGFSVEMYQLATGGCR